MGPAFDFAAQVKLAWRGILKRFDEVDERLALAGAESHERSLARLGFAAVPEDRFFDIARSSVVKQADVAVDGFDQSETPKRGRSPFLAAGFEIRSMVRELLAHVMEQEIGVRIDVLIREGGDFGIGSRSKLGSMAACALGFGEELLALAVGVWVSEATRRRSERF